jgi:D-inositol-3-phosphate glycosyltransferase
MLSIHSSPIGKLGTRDTGGMSVYIRELAREIGRRGHRVDIYTRSPSRNAPAEIQIYPNVRLLHLRGGGDRGLERDALYPHLGDFFRALESTPQIQKRQYDLIHSHYWLSGWLGSWAAKRWNCPHVVTFHTLGIAKDTAAAGPPESRMRTATEREVSRLCDRVLSSTGRDRQQLIEGYHADPDKVRVVPCGVDLSLFRPAGKRAARKRLGLAPDAPVALYVGRFDPVKGMDRLLEAIAQTDRSSRLQLVIVGGDGRANAEHRRLQAKSRQLGIDDRVRFVGRIDQLDLPPYYHAADMLVLPSHYESFGLVTLEALGCGVPVVATPVGVAAEILQPRRNGWIVDSADPGGLARGIQTVFDWQRRGLLSPETIRSSVEAYRWNRIASTMLAEYRQVLGGPDTALHPVPSERASCL